MRGHIARVLCPCPACASYPHICLPQVFEQRQQVFPRFANRKRSFHARPEGHVNVSVAISGYRAAAYLQPSRGKHRGTPRSQNIAISGAVYGPVYGEMATGII